MDDKIPVVNTEYTVEKFDGEILLYTATGTQTVYLSDEAHAVWSLCKEGMTVGQIINYLEQVYPDQKKQISKDVITALETLQAHNVMEITDAG